MEYQIQYADGYFFTKGKYPDRLLRRNGFRFDPGKELWWTRSHRNAELVGWLTDDAQKAINEFNKNIRDSKENISREDFPAPPGLDYFPFQKVGIRYILNHEATLLSDSPGLGKTIQILGAINTDLSIRRVLIIAPVSVSVNWIDEFNKWTMRKFKVEGFHRNAPISLDQDTIVIVSYRRMFTVQAHLSAIKWDLVVLDEGHYIKNVKAIRTTMITGVKSGNDWLIKPITGKRRVVITGTPILNRPEELYPILNFLKPDIWWSRDDFLKRYCDEGASNLKELGIRLRATLMLRRAKETVLPELPSKLFKVETISAPKRTDAALREYRKIRGVLKKQKELYDDFAKNSPDILFRLNELSKLRKRIGLDKVAFLRNNLDVLLNDEETKVVFFAHHKEVLQNIYGAFKSKAVILTGDTDAVKRKEAVNKFQTDPSCKLFVGSIQAAGFGITLTEATHVVFGEMDWVPSNIQQCIDRCSRIGSKHSIVVSFIVFFGSLEYAMARRIVDKQLIIDETMQDFVDI